MLSLALKGNEIAEPSDIIRDPYVFEFLGLPENKPMMESDLERALVQQIEKFLLELGRGFMFVGTQQRVTINNTRYYCEGNGKGHNNNDHRNVLISGVNAFSGSSYADQM